MTDLRFAFRQLLKNPGFTAVAVIMIALGIGANSAIFSVVNAVILRPLPFPDSDRLLWVIEKSSRSESIPISFPDFTDWQAQQTVFEQIGVYNWGDYNLSGAGDPLRLRAAQMTATAFYALATTPFIGRVFTPDEDRPGAPRVVVLSHGLWQDRFGGNTNVINQTIHLSEQSYTVIGVMPSGFVFPNPVDIWIPLGSVRNQGSYDQRGSHPGLEGIARLKSGVTLAQARSEMDTISDRLEQQYPESNKDLRVRLDPLMRKVVGNTRGALWILLGAVGLVLAIVCANVANLLLARAMDRQKEMALRIAMGADRWRIVRQLLTESLLLAALGGVLGLLLAHWSLKGIVTLSQNALPRAAEIHMDGGVLAITALSALLTGVVFGLAPAWQASRPNVQAVLKDTARGTTSGQTQMRQGLIVAEISLTLVLLFGAGLLLRSFLNLQTINPGFSSDRVLCFSLNLPTQKYVTLDQQNVFYQSLVEKLRTVAGVEAVGLASRSPLQAFNWLGTYRIEGQPEPSPSEELTMDICVASPDYFRAMGMTLLRGRAFTDRDNRERLRGTERASEKSAGLNVIIVDEDFVRRHWPNEDPIGKQVRLPWGEPQESPVLTVVGVVSRVKMRQLSEKGGFVQGYLPAWQLPEPGRTVVMKTTLPPEALFGSVRAQIKSLDPILPISGLRTVEEIRNRSMAPQRLNLILIGVFACLALALAAIGLYGVLSYTVTQRRREIGVRIALGAQRYQILKWIVGNGLRLVIVGVSVGMAATVAMTQAVRSLLFEVHPLDPLTLAAVVVLLTSVALLACALPALRAAHIDPNDALRAD